MPRKAPCPAWQTTWRQLQSGGRRKRLLQPSHTCTGCCHRPFTEALHGVLCDIWLSLSWHLTKDALTCVSVMETRLCDLSMLACRTGC